MKNQEAKIKSQSLVDFLRSIPEEGLVIVDERFELEVDGTKYGIFISTARVLSSK